MSENTIDGRARTVRQLLDGARYAVDFYQRDYAWQPRQVCELVDDLTGRFLDFYDEGHEREQVEKYGHYFLGSIVITHKGGRHYIVDGQQRLTTLTLFLILLHHLQAGREDRVDVRCLIFSEKFGKKSFNLDIDERKKVMRRLFEGEAVPLDGEGESVRNLVARYGDLAERFPEELKGKALPYFIDWLSENVHLVEIEAYSDEDAYTIFETMNDRGLSLSLPDMLKGYVLANISGEEAQREVNTLWKKRVEDLRNLGGEEDVDFFKNWLRARHAQTIRMGEKGAENKDFERIGSEFHRWVRDHKDALGLHGSDAFQSFILRDMDFYARQALTIGQATRKPVAGLESVYYNAERGFTLQSQLLLAPLSPGDTDEVTRRKMALVADFLDIWLARRAWCFRTVSYSALRRTVFSLTKDLRGKSIPEISGYLKGHLVEQAETFARNPRFRLHQQNYRQVRHILARLTHWLDTRCMLPSHFEDLVSEGRARPFEIEHLWADKPERFAHHFRNAAEFQERRNRIGGLLLLQRGPNQSLGDAPYEAKHDAYGGQGLSLLVRSLHPLAYQNLPVFQQFLEKTGLNLRPYETFGPEEQEERQELYLRMAEWVWNPSRLDLDGEKPPVHEPLAPDSGDEGPPVPPPPETLNDQERRAFWTRFLEYSRSRTDLHKNVSPTAYSYLQTGAGRSGLGYLCWVTQRALRVELSFGTGERSRNKALFDQIAARREAVEARFGGSLEWDRKDDQDTCRIFLALHEGGLADSNTWDPAIEAAVDAMIRLRDALQPEIDGLELPTGGVEPPPKAKAAGTPEPHRRVERLAFWTRLLDHAKTRTDLHKKRRPVPYNWISAGTGRTGLSYNYVVIEKAIRVELYIDTEDRARNKALFEELLARKELLEERFGAPLEWKRLDDKDASKIAFWIHEGGWADRSTWDRVIPPAVDAMIRLRNAFQPEISALEVPA